jgi:hypothetical protein
MTAAKVIYESSLLCDDVRQEITRKGLLIGVISSELVVPAFPNVINICIYSEGNVVEAGEFQSRIKITDDVSNLLFDGLYGVPFNFVEGRFSQADRLQFSVQRQGVLSFFSIDGSSNEHLLMKRNVRLIQKNEVPDDVAAVLGIS